MIWGRWKEPNRRVRAIDPDGRSSRDWITFAPDDSDLALRERLDSKGYSNIQISAYDFHKWKDAARRATQRVATEILAGRKPEFDDHLYGVLKQHLFDLSNDRCAYCEAKMKHVDYGDVEHYRPKASVREDRAHSGYYWLAYVPANLLPSCGLCNKSPGKHNQFPVAAGTRVTSPQEPLEDEQPLLLNPYKDDPLEHLSFLSTGDVAGKTQRGKETIEICRLRRLREFRREAMEQLATTFNVRRLTYGGDLKMVVSSMIEDLGQGQDEYCNALIGHLLHIIEEEEREAAQAARDVRKTFYLGSAGSGGPSFLEV